MNSGEFKSHEWEVVGDYEYLKNTFDFNTYE